MIKLSLCLYSEEHRLTDKHISKIPGSLSEYEIRKNAFYRTVPLEITINITEKEYTKETAK